MTEVSRRGRRDHGGGRSESESTTARRERSREKGLRALQIRQGEEMIVQFAPCRPGLFFPVRRLENLGLSLHPRLRSGPLSLQDLEVAQGIINPVERHGVFDSAEEHGRISSGIHRAGFRQGESLSITAISPQGFGRLNVEFGAGRLRECGSEVGTSCIDLPELEMNPGALDQGSLMARLNREEGTEIGEGGIQISFARASFSSEIGGLVFSGGQFLDPRDFVEAGLPFTMFGMGGGEAEAQTGVVRGRCEPVVQIGNDIVISAVTEDHTRRGGEESDEQGDAAEEIQTIHEES